MHSAAWTSLFADHIEIGGKLLRLEVFQCKDTFGLTINNWPATPIPLKLGPQADGIESVVDEFLPVKLRLSSSEYGELKRYLVSKEFEIKVQLSTNVKDFSPGGLAELLLSESHFATLIDTEEILVYHDGKYIPGGEGEVKRRLEQMVGNDLRKNTVEEALGHIRRRTFRRREEFDADPFVLNLKNGLLDLRTYELRAHSPDYPSLVQLPVVFDPNADCPLIRKFLSEVLYGEDIPVVQEFTGYLLWREYPNAKVLLLVGDGSNGKSTFIGVLKALLGIDQIASRSLQELELNRFAKAGLFGKLANLYADLPDQALKSVGIFKILTGGDPVTAEHKFRDGFTFVNHAKMVFSCNRIPEVFDDTTAFFRRLIIVTFPHTFVKEQADQNLLPKLTTPEEMSGFFNWALEGLRRLKQNGWTFSYSKSTSEVRQEYIRKSSPIRAFLMDCTEVDAHSFLSKKQLYSAFTEYCRLKRLPAVTEQTFFRNLPQFAAVQEERPEINGERIRGYNGLRLKPKEEWNQAELNEEERP
jgi:putative DNA primase/helicase